MTMMLIDNDNDHDACALDVVNDKGNDHDAI